MMKYKPFILANFSNFGKVAKMANFIIVLPLSEIRLEMQTRVIDKAEKKIVVRKWKSGGICDYQPAHLAHRL